MKKKMSRILTVTLLITASVMAQEFSLDMLKNLAEANGIAYIQPLVTGFGTAMNSGLYNTAKTHGVLGFDIQLKTGIGLAPANKTSVTTFDFDLSTLDPITFDVEGYSITLDPSSIYSNTTSPNVLGGKAVPFTYDENYVTSSVTSQLRTQLEAQYPAYTEDQINTILSGMSSEISDAVAENVSIASIPGLKSIKYFKNLKTIPFPFPILQASVGLPLGIEPSVRLIPAFTLPGDFKEIGKISAFGAGIKLDIDRWIPVPLFPVDLAVQTYFQKMNIGEYLTGTSIAYSAIISKKLLFLTPYLGVGKESSSFNASYTMEDGVTKIDFDLDGENDTRFTAGLNIKIAVLQLNAEFSKGNKYNAAGIGLGVALR